MIYQPEFVYLTHYSQVGDVAARAARLHRRVDAHVNIARWEENAGEDRESRSRAGLTALLVEEVKAFGCRLPSDQFLETFATDLALGAQGLAVWLKSHSADE